MKTLRARADFSAKGAGRVVLFAKDDEISITPRQARLLAAKLLQEADRAERQVRHIEKTFDLQAKRHFVSQPEGIKALMASMLKDYAATAPQEDEDPQGDLGPGGRALFGSGGEQ